jgi:hypothetical protein
MFGGTAGTIITPENARSAILRSRYSGTVRAKGRFPMAGGITGQNYNNALIAECYSEGTVIAVEEADRSIFSYNGFPYAGGIAGKNSGSGNGAGTTIVDSWSSANVKAESASDTAFAGGIVGGTIQGAIVSRCYARGTVEAVVTSNNAARTDENPSFFNAAANAGGIAGSIFIYSGSELRDNDGTTVVEKCAALNSSLGARDTGTGSPVWNVKRIGGTGVHDAGKLVLRNNIAAAAMALTAGENPVNAQADASGVDGADAAVPPDFAALGWDFASVWTTGTNYPVLQWQNNN